MSASVSYVVYYIVWRVCLISLKRVATGFSPGAGRGPAPGQCGAQKCRGLAVLVGTAG